MCQLIARVFCVLQRCLWMGGQKKKNFPFLLSLTQVSLVCTEFGLDYSSHNGGLERAVGLRVARPLWFPWHWSFDTFEIVSPHRHFCISGGPSVGRVLNGFHICDGRAPA
jgi:hypothetical protein